MLQTPLYARPPRPTRSCDPSAALGRNRWGWIGCLVVGTLGCDFPISSSKYKLGGIEASGTLGDGRGFEELEPEVLRLVRAFVPADERCATVFAEACAEALTDCAASEACLDYGVCMRERADPTAETTCSDDGRTSIEDSWRFELVRHCWASRYAECDVGRNFECVGAYGPPSGERTKVEIRQQILVRGIESEQSAFTVSFCSEWTDCSQPVAEVFTNRLTGVYDATLSVGGKNFGVGNEWRGYRLVRGAEIPDSVVVANLPFWGRRVEITRLLSASQASALSAWYAIDVERSVFVQVVDCLSDPAPGIWLEMPTSPTARVGYVDDDGYITEGSTVATGAAGISDYDPEKPQTIRALREGRIVATWSGELSSGKPRYLRLHPVGTR